MEVRRRTVNASPGTTVILYASSPVRAVVGTARLADVQVLPPREAWRRHSRRMGITHIELRDYLDGVDLAHLLLLERVNRLDRPLYLGDLQDQAPFRPPQSFRYIHASDPTPLLELVAAQR
ncbi:hypothetical protein [Kineosporia sp. R_H_3]|uniref:hypothetical protein n=1 Tax=Kineosporia sp. R_H_3 TaxID=1961848 RepID=UPI003510A15D